MSFPGGSSSVSRVGTESHGACVTAGFGKHSETRGYLSLCSRVRHIVFVRGGVALMKESAAARRVS